MYDINFNGKSLIANAWGGCFGTSKTFKEFSMGADPITGWIEFKNVVKYLSFPDCFDFHYGDYFTLSKICVP